MQLLSTYVPLYILIIAFPVKMAQPRCKISKYKFWEYGQEVHKSNLIYQNT